MKTKTWFFTSLMAVLCVAFVTQVANADSDAFTVAVIPDTQYYCSTSPPAPTNDTGTADMYYDLTDWLANNATERNIQFAIHLGDLVQTPNLVSEWQIADAAQQTLEWSVPYSVLPGNHDYVKISTTYDFTNYNTYFGPDRFAGQSFYGGHEGTQNNNNYCFFEGGGMDFMVLSLEYEPSYSTIVWANQMLSDHPNHRVIIATHSYLDDDGTYKASSGKGYGGKDIWNYLVRYHDNVFMVLCGHVPGYYHKVATNAFGNPVIEILTDYQWEPDSSSTTEYSGEGWMNLMEFAPSENKIYFKTYSPYLGEWWVDDPLHEYVLDYEMSKFGDANRDGVVDGSDATILASYWQTTGEDATWGHGDFNDDGIIDGSDATILATHWQEGADRYTAVPEPSTSVLLLCLMISGAVVFLKR